MLVEYYWIIAIMILALLLILTIYVLWKSKKLKVAALFLVDRAEKDILGTKRGLERLNWVLDSIRDLIPTPFRALFPKSMLIKIIQWAFDKIQLELEMKK